MGNKKTTIIGVLLIVGAICTAGAGIMSGQMSFTEAMAAIGAAVTGSGFLAASDGGL